MLPDSRRIRHNTRMCVKHQAVFGGLLGGCVLLACPGGAQTGGVGGAPVCEASAVLALPCPDDAAKRCLLIGDNEVRDRLFLYPLGALGPDASLRRPLRIDTELSDIEALARTRDGEVLVYGSHSRNNRCERRANRRLFLGLRLTAGGVSPGSVPLVTTSIGADAKELFGSSPSGVLARVASAFTRGEEAADRGDCAQTLDIEGAVVVGDDVWLGLRRPLVDGHAAIVRHDVRSRRLRFDDARLLDVRGNGVRGLTFHEGDVYGLSRGVLWRFPASALESSGSIPVEHVADVPPNSEGVAIHEGRAIVVQDGVEGSPACEVDSHYVVVPLGVGNGP